MLDLVTLVIGGILFLIAIMFLFLVGAVIYQYSKNKTRKDPKSKQASSKEWTWWKKLNRSLLVIGLWIGLNYLGWKGLMPEFWETWYSLGENFFWASHIAIISIFLADIWLRDEANKNKKLVNGIMYSLATLLVISAVAKLVPLYEKGILEKTQTGLGASANIRIVERKIEVPPKGASFIAKNTARIEFLLRDDSACVLVYPPTQPERAIKNCAQEKIEVANGVYTDGKYVLYPAVANKTGYLLVRQYKRI